MTKDELVIKLGFAKKSKEAVIWLLLKSTRQTVQSRSNIVLSTFRNNIVSNIILKVFFEGLITSASFCMSRCWRKQPKPNTTPNTNLHYSVTDMLWSSHFLNIWKGISSGNLIFIFLNHYAYERRKLRRKKPHTYSKAFLRRLFSLTTFWPALIKSYQRWCFVKRYATPIAQGFLLK